MCSRCTRIWWVRAGVQLEPEQVDDVESGHDEASVRADLPERRDRHPLAVHGVASDRGIDHRERARRDGPRPARRRCGCTRRAAIAAPSRRWARSVLATTIRPEVSRSSRCTTPGPALGSAGQGRAASHQRVDQRIVPVAGRGMHHQPGRLVDDGEVLVFVHDGEREWRRDGGCGEARARGTEPRRARRGPECGRPARAGR